MTIALAFALGLIVGYAVSGFHDRKTVRNATKRLKAATAKLKRAVDSFGGNSKPSEGRGDSDVG